MNLAGINQVIKPAKKGGGAFGSVLGGVLGAIAGAALAYPTGGASLAMIPAAAAGAGAGMSVGGIAGEALDPTKAAEASPEIPMTEGKKPALSYMMKMPEVQLATMANAKNLLATSDIPGAQDYMEMLGQASGRVRNQLGGLSSIGMG